MRVPLRIKYLPAEGSPSSLILSALLVLITVYKILYRKCGLLLLESYEVKY